MSSSLVYARETFADTYEEAKPLLHRHWEEIARNKDIIPLVPDEDLYRAIEGSGALRIYTVRLEGRLVGYACFFVRSHLHYMTTIIAASDIIWLAPEMRRGRAGINLLKFCEQELRAEGVVVMQTVSKAAHPALPRILDHLGHTMIEIVHAKVL